MNIQNTHLTNLNHKGRQCLTSKISCSTMHEIVEFFLDFTHVNVLWITQIIVAGKKRTRNVQRTREYSQKSCDTKYPSLILRKLIIFVLLIFSLPNRIILIYHWWQKQQYSIIERRRPFLVNLCIPAEVGPSVLSRRPVVVYELHLEHLWLVLDEEISRGGHL